MLVATAEARDSRDLRREAAAMVEGSFSVRFRLFLDDDIAALLFSIHNGIHVIPH